MNLLLLVVLKLGNLTKSWDCSINVNNWNRQSQFLLRDENSEQSRHENSCYNVIYGSQENTSVFLWQHKSPFPVSTVTKFCGGRLNWAVPTKLLVPDIRSNCQRKLFSQIGNCQFCVFRNHYFMFVGISKIESNTDLFMRNKWWGRGQPASMWWNNAANARILWLHRTKAVPHHQIRKFRKLIFCFFDIQIIEYFGNFEFLNLNSHCIGLDRHSKRRESAQMRWVSRLRPNWRSNAHTKSPVWQFRFFRKKIYISDFHNYYFFKTLEFKWFQEQSQHFEFWKLRALKQHVFALLGVSFFKKNLQTAFSKILLVTRILVATIQLRGKFKSENQDHSTRSEPAT